MGHVFKMKPVLHDKIWGGTKLREAFGYELPSETTGEAWVISAHPNGDCEIADGEFAGKTLSQLYAERRDLFGNIDNPVFPLMVKFIDASDNLSVQVHPDDAYAAEHENSLGKTESWYVLGADERASLVMGHNAKTREELADYIKRDDYDHLLNTIKVNEGDFFYIPSGTLHAIGAGCLIYEAQQSSDITYRVYDYHRKDAQGNERELHVQQSIDVTTVPAAPVGQDVFVNTKLDHGSKTRYLECEYLAVDKYRIGGFNELTMDKPFAMISVIAGEGTLGGMDVKRGDNLLVCSDVDVLACDGGFDFMMCTL